MKFKKQLAVCLLVLTSAAFLGGCSKPETQNTKAYLSDSAVTARVKTAIFSEPSLSSFEIGVETYKGTVQLSGFVDSSEEVRRASEVARNVAGVQEVKNDLQVKARRKSSNE